MIYSIFISHHTHKKKLKYMSIFIVKITTKETHLKIEKKNDDKKMEISMSKTAYCKLLLHLSKYPHHACNGLFLAKTDRESNSYVEIVDCIPLFHSSLTLAPSFEIALTQIDHYCQKSGLSIFGPMRISVTIS